MDQDRQDRKVVTKKSYASPNLWVHGDFEELTRATGSPNAAETDNRGVTADRRTH